MPEIDRPNIIFINTDQQRADTLGCYGNDLVETPNIDELASNGTLFENAHCTHPMCAPSRASLLTGRYPNVNGTWRNGLPVQPSETTIAELLREAGYHTGLIGKAHFTPYLGDPSEHPESVQTFNDVDPEQVWEYWRGFDGPYFGFDHVRLALGHSDFGIQGGHYGLWLREEYPQERELFFKGAARESAEHGPAWKSKVPANIHSTNWVADETMAFAQEHANEPFFAWVGFPDPHEPFDPPEPYCDMYDPADVPMPADPDGMVWDDPPRLVNSYVNPPQKADIRERTALYYGMVSLIDDAVGRIIDELKHQGIWDETIVVFTSDHGDWLGDHGMTGKGAVHTQGVTRVPWIVSVSERFDFGARIPAVASHIDLVPTLLDFAGIEIPYRVQGTSLVPVILGEEDAVRPYALVQHRHERYRVDSEFVQNFNWYDVLAYRANHSRKQLIEYNVKNLSNNDIYVNTIVTDDYRFSQYTGIGGESGELFWSERDSSQCEKPELRSRYRDKLLSAIVQAQDPLPERKWPV